MNIQARRILTSLAFGTACLVASQANAQVMVLQPTVPAYSYTTTNTPTRVVYGRNSILPGFSRRGGMGTTPFLGNRNGLGAFSRNYDAPRRVRVRRWWIR